LAHHGKKGVNRFEMARPRADFGVARKKMVSGPNGRSAKLPTALFG
jgi:hypothetical protein